MTDLVEQLLRFRRPMTETASLEEQAAYAILGLRRKRDRAFKLLQLHYRMADCVMPNELESLEEAMKLLSEESST